MDNWCACCPSQRERRSSLATSPMWTLFDLSNSVSWDCNEAESFRWNFWDMSQGHLEGMIKDFKWSAAEAAKSCPRDGIFNAAALGAKLSRMLFGSGEGLVIVWGSVKNWEIPVFHGLGSCMLLVPALKKKQALIWGNFLQSKILPGWYSPFQLPWLAQSSQGPWRAWEWSNGDGGDCEVANVKTCEDL